MMRSLWTAASGMIAQQTNVDTIANNLSNVNTTGYKTEKLSLNRYFIRIYRQEPPQPTVRTNRFLHR